MYVCENAHGLFEKTFLYSCLLNFKFLCSLRKMTFYKQLSVTTISDSLISPITLITLTAWNLANTVLFNLPQVIKCRTLKPFLIKNVACRSLCFKNTKKYIEKRQVHQTKDDFGYMTTIILLLSRELRNLGCLDQFVKWDACELTLNSMKMYWKILAPGDHLQDLAELLSY